MDIKKKINGDKALVRVDGRVDMNNAKILLDKLSPLVFSCNEIVLDIEGMQYISSAGLRLLQEIQAGYTQGIMFSNASPAVKRILKQNKKEQLLLV